MTPSVSPKTTGTATATIIASRQPRLRVNSAITITIGDPEALDQLVDLLVGGQAGVAGDDQLTSPGTTSPPQLLGGLEDRLGDGHRVGPLLLGDRERDRGLRAAGARGFAADVDSSPCRPRCPGTRLGLEAAGRSPAVADVAGHLGGAVADGRHVLEEDGPVLEDADDQLAAAAPGRSTAMPRLDRDHRVVAGEVAGGMGDVGPLDAPAGPPAGSGVGLEPLGVEIDAHRPGLAADDVGPRHARQRRRAAGPPPRRPAARRSCRPSAPVSVSVTTGTSSISTGLTTQPVTPGGMMSWFSLIFLNSLTRLRSRSWPT